MQIRVFKQIANLGVANSYVANSATTEVANSDIANSDTTEIANSGIANSATTEIANLDIANSSTTEISNSGIANLGNTKLPIRALRIRLILVVTDTFHVPNTFKGILSFGAVSIRTCHRLALGRLELVTVASGNSPLRPKLWESWTACISEDMMTA
ncbi:hypothetical protein Tco_0150974 [Tanacetum coccineum]